MSRNIGRTDCYFCAGKVVHDEAPRPITRKEAGAYFPEYEGMLVARSRCHDCEAKYLAWVRGRSDWTWGHLARGPHDGVEHIDLSYLSTFNDEYGAADLPVYKVGKCRIAADGALTLLTENKEWWR